MHASLKVISVLLSYPTAELQDSVADIRSAVDQDCLLDKAQGRALVGLAADIAAMDLFDAQERYVWLFDRTRSLSLHMFEHVHGESRDRGQAMVGLLQLYEDNNLATRPIDEVCGLLGQAAHINAALMERLRKRKSVYAEAFEVLVALAEQQPDQKKLKEILEQAEDDPCDLDALDKIWHEETVTFGGGDSQRVIGLDELRSELKVGAQRVQQSVKAGLRQEI